MSRFVPATVLVCYFLTATGCGGPASENVETTSAKPTQAELEVARADLPKPKAPLKGLMAMEELGSLQRGVSETAADALGRIGPAAIPALLTALKDPDPQVRKEAARALARMGPEAAPALDALIAALKDPDEKVRRSAAQAIGQIGPAAQDAIPALVEALRDYPQEPAYP